MGRPTVLCLRPGMIPFTKRCQCPLMRVYLQPRSTAYNGYRSPGWRNSLTVGMVASLLSLTGLPMVPLDRIELPIDDYKSTVIPFN